MDQRRSHPVRRPRRRPRLGIASLAPLAAVLLLAACGGSVSIEASPAASGSSSSSPSAEPSSSTSASPSPGTTDASPSPNIPDSSPSPDTGDISPSPSLSATTAEQQVLADYFTAVQPAYEEFMTAWSRAWRIVDKRAHDTMDQTWAIAAGLLADPLAQMSTARRLYRNVAPIPASLITANTRLGRSMENVQTYFAMARKGYAQGMDMDDDTAYGRKMGRIAKLDQWQYKMWKRDVKDQSAELGVPVPWSWIEE